MTAYIRSLSTCDDFIETDRPEPINRVHSSTRRRSILRSIHHSISTPFISKVWKPWTTTYGLRLPDSERHLTALRLKLGGGRGFRGRGGYVSAGRVYKRHVLVHCELTRGISEKYGKSIDCFKTFMACEKSKVQLHMLHEILDLFKD